MSRQEADFGSQAREAFRIYLRTGRRAPRAAIVQFKFNPYHDPRNGQFTFAPGGPRSLSHVVVSPRGYMPGGSGGPTGRRGRGGNIGAFYDPMTLQQVFPGLRSAPGGAIIAVADQFLNITGPANELHAELTKLQANALFTQIRKIDPHYRLESFGFPQTHQGRVNYLDGLRMDRAAALYRVRGETEALKVETLRFLQRRVDLAHADGVQRYNDGRLNVRLSREEAIGNYIDRRVRDDIRQLYNQYGIRYGKNERIKIVGREYDTSGSDRTYTIPDNTIDRLGLDMTMSLKSMRTAQIRGFFNADIRLDAVAIIRPSQIPNGGTYIIKRPGR